MKKLIILAHLFLLGSLGSIHAQDIRQDPFPDDEIVLATQEECTSLINWDKWIDEISYLFFDRCDSLQMRQEIRHMDKEEFATLLEENLKEQESYLSSIRILTYALAGTALATGFVFSRVIHKLLRDC